MLIGCLVTVQHQCVCSFQFIFSLVSTHKYINDFDKIKYPHGIFNDRISFRHEKKMNQTIENTCTSCIKERWVSGALIDFQQAMNMNRMEICSFFNSRAWFLFSFLAKNQRNVLRTKKKNNRLLLVGCQLMNISYGVQLMNISVYRCWCYLKA